MTVSLKVSHDEDLLKRRVCFILLVQLEARSQASIYDLLHFFVGKL